MNSLVTFRSNSEGNLLPTSKQREAASAEVVSTFKAKLMAAASNAAAAQTATATATAAKSAAASSASSAAASSASSAASSTTSTTAKSTSSSSDSTSLSETQDAYQELDSAAFLQMLAVQLQNQDPTEPMDNAQMMAQLAQFSSLQQMADMNTNIVSLASTMGDDMAQLNFLSAQGMLGKYVEGVNADQEQISGTVTGVTLDDKIVMLTVDGKQLPMTGVSNVALEAPSSGNAAG